MKFKEIKVGQILRVTENEPQGSFFIKGDIVKVCSIYKSGIHSERSSIYCMLIRRPSDPEFSDDEHETNWVCAVDLTLPCKLKERRRKRK